MIEKKELRLAVQASIEAGKAIMEIYDSEFSVETKEDKSPLTAADKRANEIINSYLLETTIPIISEENKQIAYDIRKEWKECWVVDPLDGTKEFIKKNGEFTVNIALIRNEKPEKGIIYVPAQKLLYIGEVSEGKAFKVSLSSHDTSIEEIFKNLVEIEPKKTTSNTLQVVGSRSHMNQETEGYISKLEKSGKNVEIVSKGSSLKFCLIAEGKADIYPRFAPTMEWDTAAGQAICKAVGVEVINEETKKELLYNKGNLLNPWFICKLNERS